MEEEKRAELPQKAGASADQLSGVEETVLKLSGQISTLTRQQKYFRTRENRNFSTVRSTEKRIFNFSMLEGGLMVTMAGLQVFIVKMFFTGGRKGELGPFLRMRFALIVWCLVLIYCRLCLSSYIVACILGWFLTSHHHAATLSSVCKIETRMSNVRIPHALPMRTFSQAPQPTFTPSSITTYSSPTIIRMSSSTMKFS